MAFDRRDGPLWEGSQQGFSSGQFFPVLAFRIAGQLKDHDFMRFSKRAGADLACKKAEARYIIRCIQLKRLPGPSS